MKAFIIYKHLLDLDGNNFVIGGIETYLENLAQVIIKLGISPVIVQCANKDFSKKVEEIQFYGFKNSINKVFNIELTCRILIELHDPRKIFFICRLCPIKLL